ncbi:MAG: sulfotransferase [Pseudomonadota bacterium]|nr:sulfotransferase [Pseudomonadota bacterium]
MVDRLPNFFIVGAPKCGTTSLAGWLAQHPNILMSSAKEPHYYNTDFGNRHTHSPAEYSRFFKHPPAVCDAVGEASVWYLYSHAAVPNILVDVPAAKFIVMLRNPVEMAPSLHEQQLVNGTEDVADFAAAWRLQTEREAGRSIPRLCEEPKLLLYGPACRLGEQLQRLYCVAGQEQV